MKNIFILNNYRKMDNKIPIYDIILDNEEEGLTAISFVDDPAIKRDFLYFSKEKPMIYLFDDEKREVVSPILIPNQLILRQDESGAVYYIRWTEDVIRECAYRYLSNGWFNNFTIMHPMFYNKDLTYEDVLQNDVEMLRMWVVENPDADDINVKYGFELPKGTLCVHIKVNNESLWQRIRSGELRGLSIEAFTSIKLSQNKLKTKPMDVNKRTMSLFEKFLTFMNTLTEEANAIAAQTSKDVAESGELSLRYWLDNEHYMQVDAEGYVRDEEMNLVPSGKYLLADGNYLTVDDNNKFAGTEQQSLEIEEDETIKVPIAEKALALEKEVIENEEIKDETPTTEDETSDSDMESSDETADEDSTEAVEDAAEEGKVEETNDARENQSKVTIGDEEYDVPTPVAELIQSLISQKSEALSELEKMKDNTPSAEPSKAPMGEETNSLSACISLLNRKH